MRGPHTIVETHQARPHVAHRAPNIAAQPAPTRCAAHQIGEERRLGPEYGGKARVKWRRDVARVDPTRGDRSGEVRQAAERTHELKRHEDETALRMTMPKTNPQKVRTSLRTRSIAVLAQATSTPTRWAAPPAPTRTATSTTARATSAIVRSSSLTGLRSSTVVPCVRSQRLRRSTHARTHGRSAQA